MRVAIPNLLSLLTLPPGQIQATNLLLWLLKSNNKTVACQGAVRIALCSLLACGLLPAQELKVWSEFQRIDPFGEVVAVDRVEHPREILSPAVARNAFVSFHVAVTVPENTPSFLYLQQNPEWLKITMYKEEFH